MIRMKIVDEGILIDYKKTNTREILNLNVEDMEKLKHIVDSNNIQHHKLSLILSLIAQSNINNINIQYIKEGFLKVMIVIDNKAMYMRYENREKIVGNKQYKGFIRDLTKYLLS